MSDTAVSTDPAAGQGKRYSRYAVPLICLAQFIVVLDATIVNVALPSIGRALHVGGSGLAWIADGYVLTFGGLLLLGGGLGDVLGKRRVFLSGIVVFTAASLACGLAGSAAVLVAARLFQGVGGAMISPAAISLIATMVPAGRPRTAALALYGAMGGLGAMMGELLGGVLTAEASWRWVFGVNVPVGLVLLIAAPLVLTTPPTIPRRLNVLGALLGTATLITFVYALIRAGDTGWTDHGTLTALAATVVLAAGFVVAERMSQQPIVPVHLLANGNTLRACLTYLLVFAFGYPAKFLLTRLCQDVLGYSALRTGLLFLPAGAAIVLATLVARRVLPRVGASAVAFAGAAVSVVSGLWLIEAGRDSSYLVNLLVPLIALGAGFGWSAVSNTVLAMDGLAPAEAGAGAGLFTTSGQIGGALGIAAATSIASTITTHRLLSGATVDDALVAGFRPAFAVIAVLAAAAAVISVPWRRARPAAASGSPNSVLS
ncbi:MFS transporter [Nocardia sp. BMG111209]|uniref:MFS transporter n=1 Tax=Nocardia sp. BMG111209 TaxID=1160137 RepID=UPI0003775D82|nr:MFS transporter [Nocardia sp. BMG111209]